MKKLVLVLVLVISMMVGSACSNTKKTTEAASYEAEINKEEVMSFDISVDEEQWQTMLDNALEEEYIPADVTINGTTIKNVGIRPKGNSSLMQVAIDDTTDRYSFRIKA